MTVHVYPMDVGYDAVFAMVRGVDTPDEAVAAALAWTEEGPLEWDEACDAEVRSQGWFRWVPCYCGDGHKVDLTIAAGPGRGAFYGYEVGYRR